jgi:hypothetical protein
VSAPATKPRPSPPRRTRHFELTSNSTPSRKLAWFCSGPLAGFYFGVDMSAWRRRVVRLGHSASIPRAASNSPTLLSRSPGAAGPASRLKARFTRARSAEGGRTLKVSKDRWGRRRDCGLAFGNPRDDRPPRSRIAEDRLIMKTQHAPFQPLSADIDEKIESLAREKGYFAPDRIRAP